MLISNFKYKNDLLYSKVVLFPLEKCNKLALIIIEEDK